MRSRMCSKTFLPQEATRQDTNAYLEMLLDKLLLQLSCDHTIVHPDGAEEEKQCCRIGQ